MTSSPFRPRPTRKLAFHLGVSALLLSASALAVAQDSPSEDVEITVESGPSTEPAIVTAPPPQGAPVPPTPPVAPAPGDVAQLEETVGQLNRRLLAAEEALRAQQTQIQAADKAETGRNSWIDALAKRGVSISGYLQVQYSRNELSEDQLLQGGSPLNQNRFAVRRGRLRVNGRWKYVRSDFELDGSNTRGPTVSVRRASLSGVLPSEGEDAPPLVLLTAGLTEIPLGLELQQGQDEILFLERTTGSLAFFAGPVDTGAKVESAYGPFRLQLAVMNGVPLDDRAGGPNAIDPTNAPDYLGRVGVDLQPSSQLSLAGGASFLTGKGFHAGSDATKPFLQWDDANADGEFSTTEVIQVSGEGAKPSKKFDRWAVGADLSLGVRTKLGTTKVYGEVLLATNLDRALFVADPTLTSQDVRELYWYAAFTQDVSEWAFVGLRYDVYDPNSDLVDARRGRVVPTDARIKTWSPIAGLRWGGVGRLTFQYDRVEDSLGRDRRGVPTDVANNQWTLRAQGEF